MDYEDARDVLIDELKKRAEKESGKTKFYFNDLTKILGVSPRDKEVKNHINRMVQEELLVYWTSGSTSMYGLPGVGKQAAAEHED